MKRYGTQIATIIIIVIALVLGAFTYMHRKKREADRKACILNISNIQLAVRSYQGMNENDIPLDGKIDWSEVFSSPTSEKYLEEPTCPYDGSRYILQSTHPQVGVPVAECPHCDSLNHRPKNITGW